MARIQLNPISNDSAADAVPVQQNFEDIASAINGGIDEENLADGGVVSSKLAQKAVLAEKLANDSVGGRAIKVETKKGYGFANLSLSTGATSDVITLTMTTAGPGTLTVYGSCFVGLGNAAPAYATSLDLLVGGATLQGATVSKTSPSGSEENGVTMSAYDVFEWTETTAPTVKLRVRNTGGGNMVTSTHYLLVQFVPNL